LFRPVIEVFYLLRSWKVTAKPRGWLSIWSAGFYHTQNVATILKKLNMYSIKIWYDTVGENASRNPVVNLHNKPTTYTDIVENRCVVFDTIEANLSSFNCLFQASTLSKLRIDLLGPALYLYVLNGGVLSQEQINKIVGNDKQRQKMLNKLFLTKS
jgi:hypothetical protein